MRSYECLILEALEGDTPKAKYEYLLWLKDQNGTFRSKANHASNNFKVLADTPALENIKSVCTALHEVCRVETPQHIREFAAKVINGEIEVPDNVYNLCIKATIRGAYLSDNEIEIIQNVLTLE